MAADRLSMRLLSVPDDDVEQMDQILQESLDMAGVTLISTPQSLRASMAAVELARHKSTVRAGSRLFSMTGLCLLACGLIICALWIGAEFIGPPNQPVGPYQLVERQVRSFSYCVGGGSTNDTRRLYCMLKRTSWVVVVCALICLISFMVTSPHRPAAARRLET